MAVPILNLNTKLMDYIYEFLDVKSKFNFAKAFTQWTEDKLSRFDLNATEQNCIRHNRTCGCHLVVMFREFFPNIEQFIFHSNWPDRVKDVFFNETSIKSIKFMGYPRNYRTEENDILSFRNLPNLKKLILTNCEEYTGKNLRDLVQLEELTLECSRILPENLIASLRYMSKLRVLVLHNDYALIQNTFSSIIKYGQNLQKLGFYSCSTNLPFDELGKLPKLRSLEIIGECNYNNHILLDGLAYGPLREKIEELILPDQHQSYKNVLSLIRLTSLIKLLINLDDVSHLGHLSDLEFLEIKCKAYKRDDEFLSVLKFCPKLKYLKTNYKFVNSKQFVLDTIKYLRSTRNPYARPFQLWLGAFDSLGDILETPEYKNATNFIKLQTFDVNNTVYGIPQMCIDE